MIKALLYEGEKFEFHKAMATNTRLMGVVGLEIIWTGSMGRELLQIFHLDYESYGIDGYHAFVDGRENDIAVTLKGVTGGLGGIFKIISWEDAMALIISAISVDPISVEMLVDFEIMASYINTVLNEIAPEIYPQVIKKLSPEKLTEVSLINYGIMRLVGCDYEGAKMLFENEETMNPIVEKASTLIKNVLAPVGGQNEAKHYEASALVDFDDKYKLLLIRVTLSADHDKIATLKISESMVVSSIEASFNLNKAEHMLVLHARDAFFERRFERQNPEFMKQHFQEGRLYIEYNPHNLHVEENPYYLNGDLYASYYFLNTGQVIVSSFDRDNILEIDTLLNENGIYDDSLSFICELRTDHSVLYSFAQSGYDNIFDFLDQRSQ